MNNKHFFITLAAQNIKKNGKFYFPYILTFVGMVTMFFNICSIAFNEGLKTFPDAFAIQNMMKFGAWTIAIFSVIFLFYTNSFLIKRRKKEFGLYHILGMEKKHIAKVLFVESVMVTALSLVLGTGIGIVLNQVILKCLVRLMGYSYNLKAGLTTSAFMWLFLLFGTIFAVNYISNVIQLAKTKTIDLLNAEKTGEREPKTKWLMAFFGFACIGIAYYIAFTVKSPIKALGEFFLAVILVIFGTYALFTAGSIVLLKALKKNKNYYYKTSHFTTVSGMIYRMKQNAAGLASICVLATMVIVMVSGTVCLYLGMEDSLNNRYKTQFDLQWDVWEDKKVQSEKTDKINKILDN